MTTAEPEPTSRPPVDPAFGPLMDLLAQAESPLSSMEPPEAREMFRMMRPTIQPDGSTSTRDITVPGPGGDVPARVVTPTGAVNGVLVWFHGGGWVIGDLDTADDTTRRLATGAGCVVVSVDYRLAPEHPAPAGFDDCWAVTTWVVDHLEDIGLADPARGAVAVGGDSAGGNLAALVALRAAREGGPDLALQLLVYPATDLTLSQPSVDENGEGYFLTADSMRWFTAHHLSGGIAGDHPSVSPLHADLSTMEGLAAAVVHVAGYDPLRDEGLAYAAKLADAGVEVDSVEYPTMIHGFYGMPTITPVAQEAIDHAARALRRAFGQ